MSGHNLYVLHQAALTGNVSELQSYFSKNKGNPLSASTGLPLADCKDNLERTPLHHAAFAGHKQAIKILVSNGAGVDVRDEEGCTPLHNAAFNGFKKAVKLLLNKGADVNSKDIDLSSPLHKAANNGHLSCVDLMTNRGSDLEATDKEGSTPLHKAVAGNHIKCVSLLLDRDANYHSVDHAGSTPLHLASYGGNANITTLLCERGANLDSKDKNGYTPLHNAAFQGHTSCMKVLVAKGAAVDATSNNQCTALHYASAKGHVEAVNYLVSSGCSLNAAESRQGRTALHYAFDRGHKEVAQALIKAGIDTTIQDLRGLTAHSLAARRHPETAATGSGGLEHESKDNGPTEAVSKSPSINRYGFVGVPNETMRGLEISKKRESSRSLKWNKALHKWEKAHKSSKFKDRIYKGIPDCVRGEVWKRLMESNKLRTARPELYNECQKRSTHTDQINKDVDRTFPKHVFFQKRGGQGQKLLFNVLQAFSVHNPEVGYCQGMGFVAAVFLMYVEEEDAFWMLSRLCDAYAADGLFKPGFPLLMTCYTLMDDLLLNFLPELHKHMADLDITSGLYTTQWFLTFMVVNLPFALLLRVLDILFNEGLITIFLVGLAILKIYEGQLLKMNFEDVVNFLKFTNGDESNLVELDVDQLLKTVLNFGQKPYVKALLKEHPFLQRSIPP